MSDQQSLQYIKRLLTLIGIIISITWLQHSQEIVVPLLVAVCIAMVASGPVNWLIQKNIPNAQAVILVLLAMIIVLILVALLLGSSIESFANQLPTYQAQLKEILKGGADWLAGYGIHISKSGLMNAIDPGEVMQFTQGLMSSIGSIFGKTILIFLTVLFMLLDAGGISKKIQSYYGTKGTEVLQVFNHAVHNTRKYMALKTVMNLLMASFIGIGLAIVGLEYAMLWAVLVFLLNYIPNIGLIIAAAPAVLLSSIQLGSTKTIIVILIYLVVNSIVDLFIQPRFIGSKMGLPLLIVFLSVFFWGWVLGPFGMILSVPLTMMINDVISAHRKNQL